VFPNPYDTERHFTGQSPFPDRCPICGSTGECPDAAPVPMPYPAVDPDNDAYAEDGGPLRLYAVTVFGFTSNMRLNDADAARYGDAAALIT
jgi:hypothetical protein